MIHVTNHQQAIARSISHNEIVTIQYDRGISIALALDSEGSVHDSVQCVTEYWGVNDDGQDWRVHMRDNTEGPEMGFPGHDDDA